MNKTIITITIIATIISLLATNGVATAGNVIVPTVPFVPTVPPQVTPAPPHTLWIPMVSQTEPTR